MSQRIKSYAFKADVFSPEDIVHAVIAPDMESGSLSAADAEAVLAMDTESALDVVASWRSIDRYNESSFDTDDFPKVDFEMAVEDYEAARAEQQSELGPLGDEDDSETIVIHVQ